MASVKLKAQANQTILTRLIEYFSLRLSLANV